MNKIKITRGGGYDPKLGPKHPDNQDPTLVKSTYKDGDLQRTVSVEVKNGRIVVKEVDNDENYLTVEVDRGEGSTTWVTARVDATQLWTLARGIVSLFGGTVLSPDGDRERGQELRGRMLDVLQANESRCLDDNIDRDAVLAELLKALS